MYIIKKALICLSFLFLVYGAFAQATSFVTLPDILKPNEAFTVAVTANQPYIYVHLILKNGSFSKEGTYLYVTNNGNNTWTWNYSVIGFPTGTYNVEFRAGTSNPPSDDYALLVGTTKINVDVSSFLSIPTAPAQNTAFTINVTAGQPYVYVHLLYTNGSRKGEGVYQYVVKNSNGTWTWTYAMPALPAGNYTLEFRAGTWELGKDNLKLLIGRTQLAINPPIAQAVDDFDVCFIQRKPLINYVENSTNPRVEGWPAVGQQVAWQANVKNWGATPVANVQYQWKLDGVIVKIGTLTLVPGMTLIDCVWPWEFKRHTLEFVIDSNNAYAENCEGNNTLGIFTDAISIGFWVEQDIYNYFHAYQKELGVGSNSWEDWAQRQVRRWNQMFASAVYGSDAPAGVSDRLRLDAIHVVNNGSLPLNGGLATNDPDMNDKTIDLEWGFPSALVGPGNSFYSDTRTVSDNNAFYYEGSLMHELGHARYLIDLYGFNVHDNGSGNTIGITEGGKLIVGTPYMPLVSTDAVYYCKQKGLMNGEYTYLDQYSTMAFNLIKGRRAVAGNYNAPGNLGVFLNDLPATNYLVLKDQSGSLLTGASVSVYQAIGQSGVWYGKYFDNSPDISGLVTDAAGGVLLGKCPFSTSGSITHYYGLSNGVMILRVQKDNRVGYGFIESTSFNMEYWRGHTSRGTYELAVNMIATAPALQAELAPATITYAPNPINVGSLVTFDSGVINSGAAASGVFNVKWFIDNVQVGYGSHTSVPVISTVMNGNSALAWTATAGTHTISFVVDADDFVRESNEANNSTTITVYVK